MKVAGGATSEWHGHTAEDVIEAALAHHRRQAEPRPVLPVPAPGYRPESLDVLFGKGRW